MLSNSRPPCSKAHSAGSRRMSWRSRVLRCAIALLITLRFKSIRGSTPDVAELRKRAHRLSGAGRWASKLLYRRSSTRPDSQLRGEWVWPNDGVQTDGMVILYLHGGAYYMGSPATHRAVTTELANAARARVFALDYRLAPEHPFPAALDDARSAYQALIARGITPGSIVLAGDSAGGGLALATLVALRDIGAPLPACAILLSPWADLSADEERGDEEGDGDAFAQSRRAMRVAAALYLRDTSLREPLASPARASLHGLVPLQIQTSDAEALYQDACRLAGRVMQSRGKVELSVWHGLPHAWHCFTPFIPEARAGLRLAAAFIRRCVPAASSPDSRTESG
jgi:monoterpene epsilon-lactone hydrolase